MLLLFSYYVVPQVDVENYIVCYFYSYGAAIT